MPDDDDLTRRFAVLSDAAVPPLPGAAAARARGAQRTRRTRAALVSATAVATVLAVGAGVSLAGGGTDRETLPPARPAPSASPSTQAPVSPAGAALLDAADAGTALGGTWQQAPAAEVGAALLPAPCAESRFQGLDGIVEAERRLQGPDAQVTHLVRMYVDDAAAKRAWATLVDDVEACPAPPGVGEGAQVEVVSGLPGAGPSQAYVRQRTASRSRSQVAAFVVLVEGALVSVVQLVGPAADVEQLPLLADLARKRALAALPPDPPAPDQPPPPAGAPSTWELADAFLPPEAASAAEQSGWAVVQSYKAEAAPLADPCEEGAAPLAREVESSAERGLRSSREAGGSSLAQEVYRYSTPPAGEDAFRLYTERYYRCAEVQDPNGSSDMTIRSQVVELDERPDGSRLVVRRVPCTAGSCADQFATYVFVVRSADALSVVAYAISEDGDPRADALELARATEKHLEAVVG